MIDRILSNEPLRVFTDKTVTDPDQLKDDLRHVRRYGVAIDNVEFQPDVMCVGAAIRDGSGAVMGAFSCSMPTMRASDERLDRIKEQVRGAAMAVCGTDLEIIYKGPPALINGRLIAL